MSAETLRFLRYLEAEKGRSSLTVAAYREDLEAFAAYLRRRDEELAWTGVDRDLVRGWVAELMEAGYEPAYVRRRLSAVRSFFRYLMRQGVCPTNPAAMVRGPKGARKLPTFVRESQMDRLLDEVAFGITPQGRRDRLVLLTFYHTGMRLAELVGLNLADVDTTAARLTVLGKRNKQRAIPFGPELAEALRHYVQAVRPALAVPGESAFFVGNDGRRIRRSYVAQTVRERLAAVTTQQKRSPHVLRHTFATVMLNHGADIESVKELLGHASLAATAIYTHVSTAELQREYRLAHPRA